MNITDFDQSPMNNSHDYRNSENMANYSHNETRNSYESYTSYVSMNDSVTEYGKKLAEKGYLIMDHIDLSICAVRLHQYKKLRTFLNTQIWMSKIIANRSMSIDKQKLLIELRSLAMKHTENLNDLLDLFKLEYKSYYITEHETEKAFNYLRIVMTKFDANNKNHNHYIILGYIAKLNIEITLLEEREKELKRRWENGEDIYLSIIEIE